MVWTDGGGKDGEREVDDDNNDSNINNKKD